MDIHWKEYTGFYTLVLQHLSKDINSGIELKEDTLLEVSAIIYC
jgi:hypothetical protein